MADSGFARPGSSAAASHNERDPIPSSPRPSVASRASRSSLRRDRDNRPDTSSGPPRPPSPTTAAAADPPPFTPLFTLITSNTHPTPRHPATSYIFADDDPEHLTAALSHHEHARPDERERERAILIDLAPAPSGPGYDVVRASSLAPDWAVVSASVVEGGKHGAMMLQIEGVTIEAGGKVSTPTGEGGELQSSAGSGGGRAGQRQGTTDEYAALVGDFESRMGVLRRVVDAGGWVGGEIVGDGGEGSKGNMGGRDDVGRRDSGEGGSSPR
ncbi:hypothetical protein QBC39DRAFT_398485 [Podospora conica]|nr:hypothetical protein QBC39DRAFT_398485 [Schizothecium conicum]